MESQIIDPDQDRERLHSAQQEGAWFEGQLGSETVEDSDHLLPENDGSGSDGRDASDPNDSPLPGQDSQAGLPGLGLGNWTRASEVSARLVLMPGCMDHDFVEDQLGMAGVLYDVRQLVYEFAFDPRQRQDAQSSLIGRKKTALVIFGSPGSAQRLVDMAWKPNQPGIDATKPAGQHSDSVWRWLGDVGDEGSETGLSLGPVSSETVPPADDESRESSDIFYDAEEYLGSSPPGNRAGSRDGSEAAKSGSSGASLMLAFEAALPRPTTGPRKTPKVDAKAGPRSKKPAVSEPISPHKAWLRNLPWQIEEADDVAVFLKATLRSTNLRIDKIALHTCSPRPLRHAEIDFADSASIETLLECQYYLWNEHRISVSRKSPSKPKSPEVPPTWDEEASAWKGHLPSQVLKPWDGKNMIPDICFQRASEIFK